MNNLQKSIEQFMSKINKKGKGYSNATIAVFFNSQDDVDKAYELLKPFFKENKFSVVKTKWDYFTINNKCKVNLYLARDYMIGLRFPYIIYNKDVKEPLVKYIIKPSHFGFKDEDMICIDCLEE